MKLQGNITFEYPRRVNPRRVNPRRGGITNIFPLKLYAMLQEVESLGKELDSIQWSERGNAFIIHNPQLFAKTLLPKHFRTGKLSSFLRQLNAYGFQRSNHYAHSVDALIFTHAIFHRDYPGHLCRITRKKSGENLCTTENKKTKGWTEFVLSAAKSSCLNDDDDDFPRLLCTAANFSLADWDVEKESLK
mmetsp:Transcript_13869/g.21135  ORF Transcript_13869/g.21135 Transcript_13869/m.21135 type:complete len:190 (+) Transcript_13869:399-968(+)